MIDLETLATKTNSKLLTIGAVYFEPNTGKVKDKFYRRVDVKSYDTEAPLEFDMDFSTIMWWVKQNDKAKDEAFFKKPRYAIKKCLTDFITWLEKLKKQSSYYKNIIPWSHGKDFDIVILQEHFNILGLNCPWKFWETRDTRTLYNFMGIDMRKIKVPTSNGLVAHHAIGDCLKQIHGVYLAYKQLYYNSDNNKDNMDID